MRSKDHRKYILVLSFLVVSAVLAAAQARPSALQIYSIDVEGGQSTLLVSPSGQSMLIDTGWAGFNGRDADRIVDAMKLAGVQRLDYVLITHYHADHVGGVPQLAEKVKIGTFVDHGENLEEADNVRKDFANYEATIAKTGAKRLTVKPGDRIPVSGLNIEVLTAGRKEISSPLPGAGQPNEACSSEPAQTDDPTENSASLGVLVTYGNFRFIDLGDLTKKKEIELVCPNNKVGKVDLYLVSHHGWDQSNTRALLQALHPRVAIMNNGAHKGGSPDAWQTVHDSPGLEDLWQLHYAADSDKAHNSRDDLIANTGEAEGNYIKVVAHQDASFEVTNSRNKFSQHYARSR